MAKRIYARTARDYENRVVKQLEAEADRILKQMREQFARDLQRQVAEATRSESFYASSSNSHDQNGDGNSSSQTASLISTAMRYLFRPKANVSQQETSRSAAANQLFRQSQSQAAADASAALARAQKNR